MAEEQETQMPEEAQMPSAEDEKARLHRLKICVFWKILT